MSTLKTFTLELLFQEEPNCDNCDLSIKTAYWSFNENKHLPYQACAGHPLLPNVQKKGRRKDCPLTKKEGKYDG